VNNKIFPVERQFLIEFYAVYRHFDHVIPLENLQVTKFHDSIVIEETNVDTENLQF
jgi:hypothetical protein